MTTNRLLPKTDKVVCWRHRDATVEEIDAVAAAKEAVRQGKLKAERDYYETATAGFEQRAMWTIANLMAHSYHMKAGQDCVYLFRSDLAIKDTTLRIDRDGTETVIAAIPVCGNCRFYNPNRNIEPRNNLDGMPCNQFPLSNRYAMVRVQPNFSCPRWRRIVSNKPIMRRVR